VRKTGTAALRGHCQSGNRRDAICCRGGADQRAPGRLTRYRVRELEPQHCVALTGPAIAATRYAARAGAEAPGTRLVQMRDFHWLGTIDPAALPSRGMDRYARVRSTCPPRPARLFRAKRASPWNLPMARLVAP